MCSSILDIMTVLPVTKVSLFCLGATISCEWLFAQSTSSTWQKDSLWWWWVNSSSWRQKQCNQHVIVTQSCIERSNASGFCLLKENISSGSKYTFYVVRFLASASKILHERACSCISDFLPLSILLYQHSQPVISLIAFPHNHLIAVTPFWNNFVFFLQT